MTKYVVYHQTPMYHPQSIHIAVALVEAHDLEEVFALTNTSETDWIDNPGVEVLAYIVEGYRSTSTEDWIQDALTGEVWEVAPMGFTKKPGVMPNPLKVLRNRHRS